MHFTKSFQNNLFIEHLQVAASESDCYLSYHNTVICFSFVVDFDDLLRTSQGG